MLGRKSLESKKKKEWIRGYDIGTALNVGNLL